MSEINADEEFYKVSCVIEELRDNQSSQEFISALRTLNILAENGNVEAGTYLAELLTFLGPNHDAEAAYKWFYISLSQTGYSVEFDDKNDSPPYYCGPVGDFRNESLVSDLVELLGFERVKELDREAESHLRLLLETSAKST